MDEEGYITLKDGKEYPCRRVGPDSFVINGDEYVRISGRTDPPEGWMRADDGNLYPLRTVSGVMAAAVSGGLGQGAHERAVRLETAMADAVRKAVAAGVEIGTPEMTAAMTAGREAEQREQRIEDAMAGAMNQALHDGIEQGSSEFNARVTAARDAAMNEE